MACTIGQAGDNLFGPAVGASCFDFTLLFEQSLLQLVPSAILFLFLPLRVSQLRRQNVKVLRSGARFVKTASIAILAIAQLVLLVLWCLSPQYRTSVSIPAAAISCLASLSLVYLSNLEHSRSIRPSSVINLYLFGSLVLDIPQARTLWLRQAPKEVSALFTACLGLKTLVLFLEARGKRGSLFPQYRLYAPEALVNLFNRTVLWWLNPLFWQGYNKFLAIEKLYNVDPDLASSAVEARFNTVRKDKHATSKWSLVLSAFSAIRYTFLAMMIPRLCLSALKLSQPLLINRLTGLLSDRLDEQDNDVRHALIAATGLLYIGLVVSTASYQRELHRLITKVRGIMVTIVYVKVLKLDSASLADGAASTLITTDVERICSSLKEVDDLFATPIEIAVAIYLLERQIGVSCIAPVAVSGLLTLMSFWSSSTAVPMQRRWLAAVTERIAYTSSVLGSPRGFKMLGWTNYFIDSIQALRVEELVRYAQYRKYVTWRNVFAQVPTAFSMPFTLMMFTLINGGDALTTSRAFTTLALVALLTGPTQNLIHAIPSAQTALASFERIQNFLVLEDGVHSQSLHDEGDEPSGEGIQLASKATRTKVQLDKACFEMGTGREILRDISLTLPPQTLTILSGPVGCGKSTLLHAILGESTLSKGIRSVTGKPSFAFCSQDSWLPNGTVRNLILAGAEFDQEWYSTVVSACALHHDIAALPSGDSTPIGSKGVSLSGGQRQRLALARAVYARAQILLADNILSGADSGTSAHVFAHIFGPRGLCKQLGMIAVLSTYDERSLPDADHIVVLSHNGTISEQGSYSELVATGSYVGNMQTLQHPTGNGGNTQEDGPPSADIMASSDMLEVAQQDLARRTGDMAVYSYYVKSIGWKLSTIVILSCVIVGFSETFPSLWVRWWSTAEETGRGQLPLGGWIGVSFLLAMIACLANGAGIWTMLVNSVPKSSATLHRQILETAMRAPYQFFVTTDAGTTLNRFSTDMNLIEQELAGSVLQFTEGMATSIFSASLPADTRQLRFLELEAQAPLLTHCTETLAGVTTNRAFGWQHRSHQKLCDLLDSSQRAYYLMLCIQRWLGLVLGLVTAAIAITVVAMALTLQTSSSAGAVGVSLLSILSFSTILSDLINSWTNLETSLGAVARCRNFQSITASEDKAGESQKPSAAWPENGSLVIKNISASYNEGDNPVLKSISLSIAAGQKIGICGRSGSGKSTLLLTLLRLLDLSSGSIEIDGLDLSTLPRQTIRERMTALPQEFVTFPGTLHANLDPSGLHSTSACEAALQKVGLYSRVAEAGGLETDMTSLNLSQGQLQLFAVARCLLRKSKVLLVDEMTSSVDAIAEETVMKLVREEFAESTIIAVAHRLGTITDFDRIVVMDAGEIVEVGTPEELKAREGGVFNGMWERMGH
ncbi:putative ABC transporter [Zymoseptoria tritici IPO323]|uniref:ABC transporter n=1 Tax=Zymoseptoria tritici (strain CBS 115943 / IPO323) TaxID=336722 RepID=F9X1Y2_ZYMTI|nr:putative ABC transporter [Zymoseptoria tritici IPO323]EGP90793.1 putative ABC transporter [Zymoseptoria tritici IPO323]